MAIGRLVLDAARAMAAGIEGHHHMVTGHELGDARPGLLHDAGSFMAKHDRLGNRQMLVAHDDVGVADAGGDDADQDFACTRLLEVEGLERKGRAGATRHGGTDLHGNHTRLDVAGFEVGQADSA